MATPEDDSIPQDLLSITDDRGKSVVRVGQLVTLYFQRAWAEETKEALFRCVDEYWESCGDKMRWAATPKWLDVKRADLSTAHKRAMEKDEQDSWQFYYHGGRTYDEASDYRAQAFGKAKWKEQQGSISYLSVSFPLAWFADRDEQLPDLVSRWATYINPSYGYAGLGILEAHQTTTATENEPTVFALGRRFPGLEVDYPVIHAIEGADGIKGVNWLTVLAQKWVDELGGLEHLRAQLDDRFVVRAYPGGIVIQSGSKPQIGDVNRNLKPKAYARLDALIKPIRGNRIYAFHHYGPHRFDHEASKAWIERFDE